MVTVGWVEAPYWCCPTSGGSTQPTQIAAMQRLQVCGAETQGERSSFLGYRFAENIIFHTIRAAKRINHAKSIKNSNR